MSEEIYHITSQKKFTHLYSICTIVNDMAEYQLMKVSFLDNGFAENCEYLIADNSLKNNFDAYAAIRRFLQEALGEYIIIVHQDVRCKEHISKLNTTLDKLQMSDPLWAICGNAGANGYKNFHINMDDNGQTKRAKGLPARVTSLDENFLLIKSSTQLTLSADINSFHFYGTDLCIIADFLGYTCYVIDFLLEHLSSGNLQQMNKHTPAFIEAYGRKLRERFIQTTCTKFILSDSVSRNRLYNKPFVFFWVKAADRLAKVFKK